MPRECHVAHHVPGRIRLKAPQAKGDHAFFHQVHELISPIDGVHRVEANPVTGSIVVHYDKNEREIEQRLEKALQDENALLSLVMPKMQDVQQIASFVESDVTVLAKHSRVAAALVDAVKAINLQIKRATNNTVDLKLLAPLAFAGCSMLFVDRQREPVLWAMLLYIAFHTFVTLHQPRVLMPIAPTLKQ